MKDAIKESIRILVRAYMDYQGERISLDGRLGIKKDGDPKKNTPVRDEALLRFLTKRREFLLEAENNMEKVLKEAIKDHPLRTNFLVDVKGVGTIVSSVLISEVDIHRADTVSSLWQYFGMNPGMVPGKVWKKRNGKRVMEVANPIVMIRGDKRTKKFVCPYNQLMKKTMLGILGPGFLKCVKYRCLDGSGAWKGKGVCERCGKSKEEHLKEINSPYAKIYYDERHRLESLNWGEDAKNPTDKKKPKAHHQHNAANRKSVKYFVQDLYVAWRTIEGLSVRPPWRDEFGDGHTHAA